MSNLKDEISVSLFKRKYSECIEKKICVMCGDNAINFSDSISEKEYLQSGICSVCQQKVFGI
jgi:hypothetical protein